MNLLTYFIRFTSIDAVDEEQHMVYFSGNSPTALNERHAYVASYEPSATARCVYFCFICSCGETVFV